MTTLDPFKHDDLVIRLRTLGSIMRERQGSWNTSDLCETAAAELGALRRERDAYLANLTSTQECCTALLEENRAMKREAGMLVEGLFNGDAKLEVAKDSLRRISENGEGGSDTDDARETLAKLENKRP